MKKQAQNLIEFVFLIPLLIILLFGIMEYGMFWRTANAIQGIALQAAIGASQVYVNAGNSSDNPAANQAAFIVAKRFKSLVGNQESDITVSSAAVNYAQDKKPFSVYEYNFTGSTSGKNIGYLSVDYRNPNQKGVITQVLFDYNTILVGAEFTLPGGNKVTIIPSNFEISSTKVQQYIRY